MVTWTRAWRSAFAWLGWTFLWGLIGLVFVGVGISLILTGNILTSSIFSGASAVLGIVLMMVGYVILSLSAVASFFKINTEIITEAIDSRVVQSPIYQQSKTKEKLCPSCGKPMIYDTALGSWFCPNEKEYHSE